jgi:HEAT repeat protein/predicted negative regulator of RcsB-dependent stress response
MSLRIVWTMFVILVLAVRLSTAEEGQQTFEMASSLEKSGKLDEAFLAYLKIPGAQHIAARIARSKAEHFLKLVRTHAAELPPTSVQLLEGDLLLATGKKDEALARYRAVASALSDDRTDDRQAQLQDGYFVEPPAASPERSSPNSPTAPFTVGPGSHRDNWLIRRFITLDSLDDVATEFARIWEIHRRNSRPYLVDMVVRIEDDKPVRERRLVIPAGFDGQGLQFALHYSFFLKRAGEQQQALKILGEPVLAIDLERGAGERVYSAIGNDAEARYPLRSLATEALLRPSRRFLGFGANMFGYPGPSPRMSRKEFVRLAYGAFKEAGEEETMVGMIQREIDKRENRLRRVLARIRFHQGNTDEALALELEYIAQANVSKLAAAFRRGRVYEDAGKLAEAVTAYEQALLPDAKGQVDILRRLERLYGALAKPDKAFDVSLRVFEADATLLINLTLLEQSRARAAALARDEEFGQWLRERLDSADPVVRANVNWLLKDYTSCGRALGDISKAKKVSVAYFSYDRWLDRFWKIGNVQLRGFLRELLNADPDNMRVRLDLLDLGDLDAPEVIAMLESLLKADATSTFARGRGVHNRTQFRNYFDLAYRLIRLYEARGQSDKVVALGLRVLEGKKPFTQVGRLTPFDTPRTSWHDRSELEDILDCVYVMLAHVNNPSDLKKITTIVDASNCLPLKNQLAKLIPERNGRLDPSEIRRRPVDHVVVRTLGPDNVRLLTHRDDVRSISSDGRWIGTSWGLVRYRRLEKNGLEILQIPLGNRVTSFCDTPTALYVGTRAGVYRLDGSNDDEPSLTRINLEAVKVSGNQGRTNPASGHPVYTEQMLWWQDALWVRDGQGLFRYEPAQQAARYYGRVPGHLFVAGGTLWANAHVYDRATDEFKLIDADGRPLRLIGATEKEVWGDVNVNNELRHRPALVDLKTRAVRVLPFANASPGKKMMVNGEFEILNEDDGRVWLLGNRRHLSVYERATGTLRHVTLRHESFQDTGTQHIGPAVWRVAEGGQFYRYYCGSATVQSIPGMNLVGDRGPYFCWRILDDHRLLLGAGIVREWREDNLGYDDNSGMSHHIQDLEGGLFEVNTETLQWQKLGHRHGELCDFYVKQIYFDERDRRAYVCTNGGVTILSLPDCQPVGRITVSDGLPSNKVEDVVRIGEKLYFACELGDEDGGLAVQDLKTKLIQRLTMADGLKCNKIKRLRADGTKLHILYGTLYGVRAYNTRLETSEQAVGEDQRVRTFRSSILDTKTGKLVSGVEVLPAPRAPNESKRLPYLGGAVLCDVRHGGKRFIGGTHGLVILTAGKKVPGSVSFPLETVKPLLSRRQLQLVEAAKVRVPTQVTLAQLQTLLRHKNPFVQANALAAARQAVSEGDATFTPVISTFVSAASDRLRSTAVWLLSRTEDKAAIAPLKIALRDPDRYIRGVAALGLARHGVLPPRTHVEEIFKHKDSYRSYPFGARSAVGLEVSEELIYAALAPHADRELFDLLLQYPLTSKNYVSRQKIFADLGNSLRKHPEAAAGLLVAYTRPTDPGPESKFGPASFAQEVFKHGGAAMLPILHKALKSRDRVIRSNAARACGSIANRSSIEPLVAALELESGFSRGSIVWALGELKAKEALPQMTTLYVDARNDEKRRAGAGFRIAQAGAMFQSQFENLRDIDAISTDWDELKQATRPDPINPQQNERLLTPRLILDAVRKIGPAASQTFYRQLAGEVDWEARKEAAARLAEGTADDRTQNIPILRNLFGDSNVWVRGVAGVSLLLLGQRDVEKQILTSLKSPENWEQHSTLQQIERVKDGHMLIFARQALQAIYEEVRDNSYQETRLRRLLGRIPRG